MSPWVHALIAMLGKAFLILGAILVSAMCVILYAGCGRIETWLTTPDRIETRTTTTPCEQREFVTPVSLSPS